MNNVWDQIRDLVDYAKGESPDPAEVLKRAREISATWRGIHSTNVPEQVWYVGSK